MEKEITCADCFHLGRAVYCMQCIRIGKGYKDMFISNHISPSIPTPYKEDTKHSEQSAKR